ncbi:MAG: hypothetical protein ABSF29_04390 [Tepidisphaeraceae bacterium]|jgi:dihydroorotate dehydrogenase
MRSLISTVFGVFSVVAISAISCSAYPIVAGIGGIAARSVEGLKTAIKSGATMDQLQTAARQDGFELTVTDVR